MVRSHIQFQQHVYRAVLARTQFHQPDETRELNLATDPILYCRSPLDDDPSILLIKNSYQLGISETNDYSLATGER
jgi:hypothetical protein